MKILLFIIILWILYRINKFVSTIQISKSKNRKQEKLNRKFNMDIQDAEYEEVE